MNAFGLTGNIGCGKSTVAKLLAKHPNVAVFDCDAIAKAIIISEHHRLEIAQILNITNIPDPKTIAKIIFQDPEKKRLLEEYVHPLVWQTVQEKVERSNSKICIVESAIIFETGSEDRFTAIITVTCSYGEQVRRLKEFRSMRDEEISLRIHQQLPSQEKMNRADFVIHTECSLEELQGRVTSLYYELKKKSGLCS